MTCNIHPLKWALFFLLSMFVRSEVKGSAYSWTWAKSSVGAGAGNKTGNSVCADGTGNVYVTGYFSTSTITFGGITLTNSTGPGNLDIFVVKYDIFGNVLWARSFGGASDDAAESIVVDKAGDVYITGYFFSPSVTFGSAILISHGPTTGLLQGQEFLVKFNSSGSVVWAKTTSLSYDTEAGGTSLSTDGEGYIYEAGYFWSATLTIGPYVLVNSGPPGITNDMFIAKYDNTGAVVWAKSAGGTMNDICYSVSADRSGGVFLTGKFSSPVLHLGAISVSNKGEQDAFVVKYDKVSGNEIWGKGIGGTNIEIGEGVFADTLGNVYVTGLFYSPTLISGPDTLTNPDTSSSALFLCKYNSTGDELWSKTITGKGAAGKAILGDKAGSIFLLGLYSDTAIVGADTMLTSYNVNGIGNYHLFVANYDSAGNALSSVSAGGSRNDYGNSLVADNAGNIYITGSFTSPAIAFGATTLTNTTTGLSGDMFVAKLHTGAGSSGTGLSYLPHNEPYVYPNPASSLLHVVSGGTNHQMTITIYDPSGRVVSPPIAAEGKAAISINKLPQGFYTVSITDNTSGQNTKVKFVKS